MCNYPLFAAAIGAVRFSSGINLVEVYATVTNVGGEPVAGLTARISTSPTTGVEQKVTVSRLADVHLSAVVAIDRSFGMAGTPLAPAKGTASAFIRALRSDDEVTWSPPVDQRAASSSREPRVRAASFNSSVRTRRDLSVR